MDKLQKLGLQIAKFRVAKNLSGNQLSLLLNKDISYISKIETGKVNVPYLTLLDICEVLEINLKELLD